MKGEVTSDNETILEVKRFATNTYVEADEQYPDDNFIALTFKMTAGTGDDTILITYAGVEYTVELVGNEEYDSTVTFRLGKYLGIDDGTPHSGPISIRNNSPFLIISPGMITTSKSGYGTSKCITGMSKVSTELINFIPINHCDEVLVYRVGRSMSMTNSSSPFGTSPINYTSLEDFVVEKDNSLFVVKNNGLLTKDESTLILGCKNTIIPEGVTRIEVCAFAYGLDLLNLNIPTSITTIGLSAFHQGSTPTIIHNFYTDNIDRFVEIRVDGTGTNSYFYPLSFNKLYYEGSLVTNLHLTSATRIGRGLFFGNKSLISVTIPSTVSLIEQSAFRSCSNITTVRFLSPTPPTISGSAFDGLSSSCTIYVPNSSLEAYQTALSDYSYTIIGE